MISEYHINQILGKLDKILENQRMILQQLVAGNNKIGGTLPKDVYDPVIEAEPDSDETVQWPSDTHAETISVNDDSSEGMEQGLSKKDASGSAEEPVEKLSKTQLFKRYRASGGLLSWGKWKLAGMPKE